MQGVILAAGKGSRLHPVTADRSKAMAPVAGKPILGRVVDLLAENGVRDFVVVVSEAEQDIPGYLQSRSAEGLHFDLVTQAERLGMAHALGMAAKHIVGDFLLVACDSLVPSDHLRELLEHHRSTTANATLCLMELEPHRVVEYGIVDLKDGKIERIVEKPRIEEAPSNIGSLPFYVFSRRLLDYLPEVKPSPRGEYELQDAIQMLIEREGHVTGVFTSHRDEITRVDDLLTLNRSFLNGNDTVGSPEGIDPSVTILPPVSIAEGTVIDADCTIGPCVTIEESCHVKTGSHIEDAIILRNSVVPAGSHVKSEVFLPPHVAGV